MWASRLRVPLSCLESTGLHYVSREDSTWVAVVELEGSQVISAPPFAIPLLRRLDLRDLLDLKFLVSVLSDFSPSPVGSALLLYDEMAARKPITDQSIRVATTERVDRFLVRCEASEVAESGLREMRTVFDEVDSSGDSVAIAGYETWSETVAQLGVLVDPLQRGRGIGRRVANAAIDDAHSKSLIPQWRVRVDNVPSVRLAAQLGFTQLGSQLALEIAAPTPHT
jgi:RimJ/RimL family protein N-acetyltransferase